MENAFRGYMFANASHYLNDLSLSSPQNDEDSSPTDSLVEYFGGKILPKISTSKFNWQKVYRFALDLLRVIPLEFVSSVMNQNPHYAILLPKTH